MSLALYNVQDLNSGISQKQLFCSFLPGLRFAKLDDSLRMGVSYSCGEVAYWSQNLLRFPCSATYWSCQLTPVLCLPTSTAAYDITLLSGSLTAWLICSKDSKNKNVLKPARCLRFVENLQRTRLSLTDGISIRFDSPKQPFIWKFWKLVEKNSFLSPSIIQNRCVYFMIFFLSNKCVDLIRDCPLLDFGCFLSNKIAIYWKNELKFKAKINFDW